MAALRLLMLFCLTAPAVLSAPAKAESDRGCPEGWTRFGSRCFKYIQETKTWIDAEKSCQTLGANLASIHSAEEDDFILDMIQKATGARNRTWIGGSDAAKEGTWLWSDGSVWDYTAWHDGEPNNVENKEHSLMVNWHTTPKFWNDLPGSFALFYMCAKNSAPSRPVFVELEGFSCHCTPRPI
ncbi:hypothetical protein WMY93_004223 [Mugilogobius chulae]|uniref:C-type lectin domain-containing protein n=1 Tax=Mugilogobius chulae TaxID=88201 RepID=A0AAW0PP71_9GOBI